ncbi:MAG: tRNA uridine-5-carboxymethylaminomethyl(34) synthesis GTPase MnmE [Actinobacteria bacterium]|nr:tRNA uridine-5-carboxymethylaminomethyl(34) synthesis GTPase MnmE [Actinomycetota bacterium]
MLSAWSDPIVAMATAPGRGAVGIVRISGKGLQSWTKVLLGRELVARMATLTSVCDSNGQLIDQVIALWFPAPHSYTGEDVLELQGHGGSVVMQMLMRRCLETAHAEAEPENAPRMRLARPGEFTERAYLNHKLDLAQAEAVADLIDASSEAAVRSATRSMAGAFSDEVHALTQTLTRLRMLVEATLDFPEEEIDFLQQADALGQLQQLMRASETLRERSRQGVLLREGLQLVIVGQPNVGKSALLNALSGKDTAIVTNIAGTTRDALVQTIHIEDVPVHVVDTAGLRDQLADEIDLVEKMGIERAWQHLDKADAVLFLHDLSRQDQDAYRQRDAQLQGVIQQRLSPQQRCLQVWNKADLITQTPAADRADGEIWISAQTGAGLEALKQQILATVGRQASADQGEYSGRERHLHALQAFHTRLSKAQKCLLEKPLILELVAEELRLAQQEMANITGGITADDLLGEIFSRFCIGK